LRQLNLKRCLKLNFLELLVDATLLKQNKNLLNIALNYKLNSTSCEKLLYSKNNNCIFCVKIFVYNLRYFFEVIKQKFVLSNNIYNITINSKVILNNIINKIELRKDYIIKNEKYYLINKVN